MAGLIAADDIATVKERTSIEDVVREHVSLRSAGVGALKGLCPFHDEKTPSFNVRPANGSYHCFGCGAGGDVIRFVQEIEHLSFAEAVESLAARLGMELRYEDGGSTGSREHGGLRRRQRLLEANRVAQEWYAARLLDAADARAGRDFLRSRGFGRPEAVHFGIGFAPRGGEELTRHLREKGFTEDEMVTAGLSGRGARGLYDRFRGRLLWPIRDTSGATLGFGARRLFDDDRIAAKYLNTAETPLYKKSQVLYGIDLARKAISTQRRAVIVEGYTDVMAAHLSGVEGAVATCGTAFGAEHISLLRRLIRDEPTNPAKVVFTFDGDAAGQQAAMAAFEKDQRWAAQSFVAVAPDGMDPCELRLAKGGEAVQALVEDAKPMFEFAVRTVIRRFDLETAEGRVQAARAAAPIIASIRDGALRPEYVRAVSGWLGLEIEQVQAEVSRAGRRTASSQGTGRAPGPPSAGDVPSGAEAGRGGGPSGPPDRSDPLGPRGGRLDGGFQVGDELAPQAPDLRDPVVVAERQLLQALLQFPDQFAAETIEAIPEDAFAAPAHALVFGAIRSVPGGAAGRSAVGWTTAVQDAAPLLVHGLIAQLVVAPLPTRLDPATGRPPQRYVDALVVGVHDAALTRRIGDATASLRRLQNDPDADPETLRSRTQALHELERRRVRLREGLGA